MWRRWFGSRRPSRNPRLSVVPVVLALVDCFVLSCQVQTTFLSVVECRSPSNSPALNIKICMLDVGSVNPPWPLLCTTSHVAVCDAALSGMLHGPVRRRDRCSILVMACAMGIIMVSSMWLVLWHSMCCVPNEMVGLVVKGSTSRKICVAHLVVTKAGHGFLIVYFIHHLGAYVE